MFLALYGDNIALSEAAFISIFSMLVVFVVLLIISYMIDVVAAVINKGMKSKKPVSAPAEDKPHDDTTAVIAAAIAAYLDTDVHNVNIKKIRRIDESKMWMRRN